MDPPGRVENGARDKVGKTVVLDPPGREGTKGATGMGMTEALDEVRVATPAPGTSGRDAPSLTVCGEDTENVKAQCVRPRTLTTRAGVKPDSVSVDLVEMDRDAAKRWSDMGDREDNAAAWPAPPGSVADMPRPRSPI